MRNDNNHLATWGNALHEYAGPVSPKPGPILPILDMTHPTDSRKPMPIPIINSMLMMIITKYRKQNASTVDMMEGDMTCLFILTGSTALGCNMCLNSFCDTLARMTRRIHFNPPVVLPAQAPITITIVSSPHKTGVHNI